jgi:hypothetical protein
MSPTHSSRRDRLPPLAAMDWFLKEAVRRINHPNALPALASIFVAFAVRVAGARRGRL